MGTIVANSFALSKSQFGGDHMAYLGNTGITKRALMWSKNTRRKNLLPIFQNKTQASLLCCSEGVLSTLWTTLTFGQVTKMSARR